MTWLQLGDKPSSKLMVVKLPTTRPQWVKFGSRSVKIASLDITMHISLGNFTGSCSQTMSVSIGSGMFMWYYSDMKMSAMAAHITDVSIVCSIVCSGTAQSKRQSSSSLGFVGRIPRSQRASNAENVSILWRHHDWCHRQRRVSLCSFVATMIFLCQGTAAICGNYTQNSLPPKPVE